MAHSQLMPLTSCGPEPKPYSINWKKGRELILWTSASRERLEDFTNVHPELVGLFAEIVCSADFLDEDDSPKFPSDFQISDPKKILRAVDILHGYEGGKIPPLVGAEVVIDDTALWMQNAAKIFNFRAIDAASKRNDSTPDAWVARVLGEIFS